MNATTWDECAAILSLLAAVSCPFCALSVGLCDTMNALLPGPFPPPPASRREGDDLVFSKRISLAEALCGTEFTVLTLDGRSLKISTKDQIIQPGSQKVLR